MIDIFDKISHFFILIRLGVVTGILVHVFFQYDNVHFQVHATALLIGIYVLSHSAAALKASLASPYNQK